MSGLETQMNKLDKRLLRIKQQKAQLMEKQRKLETRQKIELGGLVFTADLHSHFSDLHNKDGEARAIILGVLSEAAEQLDKPEYRLSMLRRGQQVFNFKARTKNRQKHGWEAKQ